MDTRRLSGSGGNAIIGRSDPFRGATAREPRIAKTFAPGRVGTRQIAREFGDLLVCVRHRYDVANALRVTTVESVACVDPLHGRARRPGTPSQRGLPYGFAWNPTSARSAAGCSVPAVEGAVISDRGKSCTGSSPGSTCMSGWSESDGVQRLDPTRSSRRRGARGRRYSPGGPCQVPARSGKIRLYLPSFGGLHFLLGV